MPNRLLNADLFRVDLIAVISEALVKLRAHFESLNRVVRYFLVAFITASILLLARMKQRTANQQTTLFVVRYQLMQLLFGRGILHA